MNLEELVGQQLMIGISGSEVTEDTLRLFEDTKAGGLIVFRPNFASAEKFKKLLSSLESNLGRRLLVAVDHEGGRVIHLAEGITVFPDNWALGNTQNEKYAARQGEIESRELRRLGIDVNLAPTLDVLTASYSPNIGIRSYGRDPELVARLGAARIRAMQAGGLSACAKHFPGQGQSPLDAHFDLPVLPTTWDEAKDIHLIPFEAAIEAGVHSIMSSHPIYPELDGEKIPATFSRRLIYELLRRQLGFQGVIFSDDLEMGALKGLCPAGETAVRAVKAGHDMILFCHDPSAARQAYAALLAAYKNKTLEISELEASAARIEHLKKFRSERFSGGETLPEPGGNALARKIAGEAIHIGKNRALVPLNGEASTSVIFPRLSALGKLIYIEKPMMEESSYIKGLFDQAGMDIAQRLIVELNPDDTELVQAKKLAASAGRLIFFCYDAHANPGMKKMLEEVQKVNPNCAVILLRNPYDRDFVKDSSVCISAFGFRTSQLEAAIAALAPIPAAILNKK